MGAVPYSKSEIKTSVKWPLSAVSLPQLQPERIWLCLPDWEQLMAGPFREAARASEKLGPHPRKTLGAAGVPTTSPRPSAEGDCPGHHLALWASLYTVTASYGPFHCISKQTQERPDPRRPASVARTPTRCGWRRAARGSRPVPGDTQSSLLLSPGFSETASLLQGPEFKSQLCHFLATGPRANNFTSSSFSFLICTMTHPCQSYCERK